MKEALCVALFLACGVAQAGEKERAARRENEVILKAAGDAFAASCGCPLKIDVKWDSFRTEDQLYQLKHTAASIKDSVDGYCKSADGASDNRKAICAMKTLEIVNGKEGTAVFGKGKAVATLTDDAYVTFDMIKNEVDK
jgi:hypothetical protein